MIPSICPKMKEMSRMALKANDFLTSNAPERHEIDTPAGKLVVYVKPLSWLQQQEAISKFVDFSMDEDIGEVLPSIDFGGYWGYILTNCIVDTEPKISNKDLRNLSPEVGAEVMKVLPGLDDLMSSLSIDEEGGDGPLA